MLSWFVPDGSFGKVSLVVKAPNANVVNNGVLKLSRCKCNKEVLVRLQRMQREYLCS